MASRYIENDQLTGTYGAVPVVVATTSEVDEGFEAAETVDKAQYDRDVLPLRSYLFRHALALTGQRPDAENLVQETMARAYVSLRTLREGSNIRSWLHRILVNKWLDNHRRAQRRPVERMSAEGVEVQVAVDSRWIDQCQQSAETEALSRMAGEAHSALLRLPVELRGVVYFACIEGYRNTEIAGILGVPVGTVASRLHRAKRRLRKDLSASNR